MSTSLSGAALIELTVPTPGGDTDVWDTVLNDDTLTQAARVMYAAREDRNISITGGGKISWDSTTNLVTFTEDIVLRDHITDKTVTVAQATASPVTLDAANKFAYLVKNREPASNQAVATLTIAAAGALPDAVGDNGNIVLFHRTSDGTLLMPWQRRELLSGDYFVLRTGYSFYAARAAQQRPNYRSVTADTSQLVCEASATKPAIVLIDGKLYVNVADKTLDLDTSGRNGLDTGTKAANTLYYLYAIPPTSGSTFDLVCSVQPPSSGPTGFSLWSYLGGFTTTTSSAIVQFQACDGEVHYSQGSSNHEQIWNNTASTAKVFLIPANAKAIYIRTSWGAVNAVGDGLSLGATSGNDITRHRATSTTAGNNNFALLWVPVIESQTIYGATTTTTTDSITARPLGWRENVREYP